MTDPIYGQDKQRTPYYAHKERPHLLQVIKFLVQTYTRTYVHARLPIQRKSCRKPKQDDKRVHTGRGNMFPVIRDSCIRRE